MSDFELQILTALLSKLDIGLSHYLPTSITTHEIKGVNSNIYQSRIQLLPRMNCFWEHNSRGFSHSNDLMNYLHFFYFIDMEQLDGYEVFNRFIEPDAFSEARERGYLQIGMSPLTNQKHLRWHLNESDGRQYFYIDELEKSEIIKQNLLGVLKEAKCQQVDILITPEMLGNYQIKEAVMDELSEFPEGEGRYPALTVLPSIWENHHNIVTVLDESGNEVIQQEKQHPYPYPVKEGGLQGNFLEDIHPKPMLHLIHCDGIGRIGIMICKDALIIKYMQMFLNVLKVTLLLIPSFSTGYYDFEEILQCCRVADCCAFWINTCAAAELTEGNHDKLETIGLVLKTGKKSLFKNGCYQCKRKSQGCNEESAANCSHCIFISKVQFGEGR